MHRYVALSVLAVLAAGTLVSQTVEFNRDIRPILSDKCFTCHGPDPGNRKTKLRFDIEEGAKQDLGGRFAIVPGDAAKSELIRRITSENAAMRMPPAYAGAARLSDGEIELFRQWIAQGAQWQKHWSLIPPRRPALPVAKDRAWMRNPIDHFVLARLEREDLSPSPEAAKTALIRRVTLDLAGLPPTLAEVDDFLRDSSPGAYEKVVDRLLASPRYGERMAVRWLDAARYADTNGYQTDAERDMWRWRDWVIEAFNRNLPFDRFTVEQIAGDLLPNSSLSQRIATGFNRNHRGNGEGGIIPEEYAVEYVVDRVETTGTVWLGLTLGCARCHDHKYDPVSQREFYQIFAFFNNIPERGRAYKYGNSPPFISAPTPEHKKALAEHSRKISEARRRFAALDSGPLPPPPLAADQLSHFSFDAEPTPGRFGQAAAFDGKRVFEGGDIAGFTFYSKFSLGAWIHPAAPTGAIITRAQDISESDGYGLYLKDGKLQLNLVQRWLDDALRVETVEPVALNRWQHVLAVYDGSRLASGAAIYVDGRPQKLKVVLDELNQDFKVKDPLRIGAGGGPENRFHGLIDDVRIYSAALTPAQAAVLAAPEPVEEIAALAPEKRAEGQRDKLRLHFLEQLAPDNVRKSWREVTGAERALAALKETIPTVMVMQERETPREAFLLLRGAYDRPGPKVGREVPAALHPFPKGAPRDRLGFARWLVDPANPLTARVAVNRFWQMYFGAGLVKTVEDFGSQGEWPAHPELLDWLATEFIRSGWDTKRMQKLIVTSATYRQSSRVAPALVQRDPENRLFARGPRFRLPAETVRDQALAVSGLLVLKIGGPSVKPYQPAGLWKELAGGEDYVQDKGENLYRRSLYTYWKRTSPPPGIMNFDAAGRETCIVRETRTNTPLQALTTMNDVTYLEAARVLAQRMLRDGGSTLEERIAFAFRLATARPPQAPEAEVLLAAYHHHLDRYQTDREAALKLVSQGEYPREEKLDPGQLAASAVVASLILNLDEVLTKE
ncbi:MAG: DUF1553 domain-containing protein [Acidobacteria bacterium]|nr:DUF1553 domain-containing protein [Acidobacteriota bacterium]